MTNGPSQPLWGAQYTHVYFFKTRSTVSIQLSEIARTARYDADFVGTKQCLDTPRDSKLRTARKQTRMPE